MKWVAVLTWIYFQVCPFVNSQVLRSETHPIQYEIAGIFEENAGIQLRAFDETMRQACLGSPIQQTISRSGNEEALKDLRFAPVIMETTTLDSYAVWKKLCSNKTMRPVAVFGPQNPISDGIVREQCALANIPHIQATWKPVHPDSELNPEIDEIDQEGEEPVFKNISVNFYPAADEILNAYAMLLKYYKWENFAVLYEDDFGLLRVQQILALHTDQYPTTIRRLDPNIDNYEVFKQVSKFKENRIILDCHIDRVLKYLNEAQNVSTVNNYQHYILTSLDASTVAEELKKFECNVTWLSIIKYDTLENHNLAQRAGKWTGEKNFGILPPVTSFKLLNMIEDRRVHNNGPLEALIIDDIANHILKALQKVDTAQGLRNPYNPVCDADLSIWTQGALLQNEILKTRSVGVTGNIEFNMKGQRVNYILYINEIHAFELETIGWVNSTSGELTEDRPDGNTPKHQKNSKHFIIISRKAKPFFFDKIKCPEDDTTCKEEDADDKYEGFTVDLVKNIFDKLRDYKLNYTYSFQHDADLDYGKYDTETKKWNGLIGELLDNKADLAVCDLTITEERKKVVDFSVPFMSLGISILFTKEREIKPGMFSFLNPYTFEVWMYTATAYCVVSIVLFVCSRISPADWENPQPCDKDPEELENIWNFKNCTWLTMGSIMCQGCDILPKAIGSRWVCGMWWFFAVIVCQTYIAQLSASMTEALEIAPINNVEDLAKQTKVLYGAIKGGSTFGFFKNSKDKMYRRMYDVMESNPVVLVNSNDEGERRVLSGKGKYAFFMESTSIEYKLKRNCELKKIGGELDSKDYGIAMPANSPFRTNINRAILELKERTTLDTIKRKWWEDKYDAKNCEGPTDENDVTGDLEMENLIGAFIVLIAGLGFSVIITTAEFMNEVRNIVVREQVTHKEVFIKELKSSLNFFQLQKPVLRNPSRAPSILSSIGSEKMEKRANAIENFLDFEKDVQ